MVAAEAAPTWSYNEKAAIWPPFLFPKHFCLSDAAVNSLAATVQAPVDLVALAIETIGNAIVPGCICAVRLPVETAINAITFFVQAILNSIATIIESVLDAVTGVCERCSTYDQQRHSNCNCLPGIHIKSPLNPYKVMLSVGTTKPTGTG